MAETEARPSQGAGARIEVYADGCFEPESGTGGWAFVAYRGDFEVASAFGHVDRSSNNAMELTAVLEAAIWINSNAANGTSVLWSDSAYAVNGCNHWRHIWKSRAWRKKGPDPKARSRPVPDRELWVAIDDQLSRNRQMQVAWCKGHAGIPGNEKSDELAEYGRRMIDGKPIDGRR